MKANGKADLYFHAYFIEKYLRSLYVLQDKVGAGGSGMNKKKSAKKVKKSHRAEGEDDVEDENQSGTKLGEADEQDFSIPPGEKIEIFSDSKFPFMKRIVGLSSTLSKVIVNIKKFPFHEKMYLKYATEFGQRQTSKKMKYLEEIQRALFVA
jgi:hypothetical protein